MGTGRGSVIGESAFAKKIQHRIINRNGRKLNPIASFGSSNQAEFEFTNERDENLMIA